MQKDEVILALGEVKGLIQGNAQESRDRAERAERNANERHAKHERRMDEFAAELAEVKAQSQRAQDEVYAVSQSLGMHVKKDEETAVILDGRMSNIELAVGVVSVHTAGQNKELDHQTIMLSKIEKSQDKAVKLALISACSIIAVAGITAYFNYRAALAGALSTSKPQPAPTTQSSSH